MAYKRSSVLVGLPDQDRGWEEVQQKTFTKWLNTKLESREIPPMKSLATDLSDGVKLIQLMEIMGDVSLGRYYKTPRMRVQKAENVNLALEFIKSRGVVLTNVGAEDIVDSNLKLILGMIWTLILRFTIAGISEEGVTAKEGLLLWCQRKTAPYIEVSVQNFTTSFKDGLALCALIHRHRPDLLDYDSLPKDDPHVCTRTAFQVAEMHLGIPQLLDVEDLCDRPKPDERSVMTYVAQYFHAFSSMEQAEVVSRRVAIFADVMQSAWLMQQDYEKRARELIDTIQEIQTSWASASFLGTYADARDQLTTFNEYKSGVKRECVRERTDLAALLGNIQTKLKTYHLKEWVPAQGLRQPDIDAAWMTLAKAEAHRSRSINAEIRNAKENLRIKFANTANEFEKRLRDVADGVASLEGHLEIQREKVKVLQSELIPIKESLGHIEEVEKECREANVEENDHTIFTLDDLVFELELVKTSVSKKLSFIENQIVSRQHTTLTPAQLEEFESTFRYFDKSDSNTLNVAELGAALASLGIIYSDDDVEQIYLQLCESFGAVSYDGFLTFLREITEDTTSPDQLLEAFQGLAGDKPYVTELDLRLALLPKSSIDYLKVAMPQARAEGVEETVYDYEGYLTGLFGVAEEQILRGIGIDSSEIRTFCTFFWAEPFNTVPVGALDGFDSLLQAMTETGICSDSLVVIPKYRLSTRCTNLSQLLQHSPHSFEFDLDCELIIIIIIMYLPRQTSIYLDQRPTMGRTNSPASLVSLQVHNSYLASKARYLSSQLGLGLASDNDDFVQDTQLFPDPPRVTLQQDLLSLPLSSSGHLIQQQQSSVALNSTDTANDIVTTAIDSPSSRNARLGQLFAGSLQQNLKPNRRISLRGYAEARWKKQRLLQQKILEATDVDRLEWEAKAAMLHHSYLLAILLFYRAGMLGSPAACIALARLYALGVTKGNKPVVVLVYRDSLRSLAWSLEALKILDRQLSAAQIKADNPSCTRSSTHLLQLWQAPLEALGLVLRAILAPEVAALSTSQPSAVRLPDISKLSGSQSAGRDAAPFPHQPPIQTAELWTEIQGAVDRMSASVQSDPQVEIGQGPDEQDDDKLLSCKLEALRAIVVFLQAILQSRSFILDPPTEMLSQLQTLWTSLPKDAPMTLSLIQGVSPLQAVESIELAKQDSNLATTGNVFGNLTQHLSNALPELSIPDFKHRPKLTSADPDSPNKSFQRQRRPSLTDLEPEDMDTTAKHWSKARPSLTTRFTTGHAAPSASVAPVLVSGQPKESFAITADTTSPLQTYREKLSRTISQSSFSKTANVTDSPKTAITPLRLTEVSLPASGSLVDPVSPTDSFYSGFGLERPQRRSSVVSVTPSLLFPPDHTAEDSIERFDQQDNHSVTTSELDSSANATPATILRSKTSSQLVPGELGRSPFLATARPRHASGSGSGARPRVTSMYSTPSTSTWNLASPAPYSTFSTAVATTSLQGLDAYRSSNTARQRAGSNASVSSLSRPLSHLAPKKSPSIAETSETLLSVGVDTDVEAHGELSSARNASDMLRRLKGQRSYTHLKNAVQRDSKTAIPPTRSIPAWAKGSVKSAAASVSVEGTLISSEAGEVQKQNRTTIHPHPHPTKIDEQPERNFSAISSVLEKPEVTLLDSSRSNHVDTQQPPRPPAFTSALLAGAMSGLTVDLLFFPIDTIKTRLQSSQGFLAAGGFKGVYRGLASTAVGSAPGASIFFTTYETMKPTLLRWSPDIFGQDGHLGPVALHMASASIAETSACLIRVPTEVIKSRQQTLAYGANTSTWQAFQMVFKESGGIRGYYRGFGSTVGREIPFTCIQFPLYERIKLEMSKSKWLGHNPNDQINNIERVKKLPTWQAGLAGSIAGAIAASLTTPLDVVKTRIMLHRKSGGIAEISGINVKMIPTLKDIVKREGVRALFSGIVPRTMWIGLGGAVFLGTFDAGIKVLDG